MLHILPDLVLVDFDASTSGKTAAATAAGVSSTAALLADYADELLVSPAFHLISSDRASFNPLYVIVFGGCAVSSLSFGG